MSADRARSDPGGNINLWFPLYASDWLLSRKMRRLDLYHQGAAMRMMALSWHDGTPGVLPADPAILAPDIRVSVMDMEAILDVLLKARVWLPDGATVIMPRLIEIGEEQRKKSRKNKLAADARWGNKQPEQNAEEIEISTSYGLTGRVRHRTFHNRSALTDWARESGAKLLQMGGEEVWVVPDEDGFD